jgi:hypothetical protein
MSRALDLTGQRFGKLVALDRAGSNKHGQCLWLCKCDCGGTKGVISSYLTSGKTKSCGCLERDRTLNLSGQRFSRFVVLEFAGRNENRVALWLCRCDCGTTKTVRAANLRNGNTKSCGCLHKEITSALTAGKKYGLTHGHYGSGTYGSWKCAKTRCLNPNHKQYPSYGGANPPVIICDRWKDSFENFLADMGERPVGTTLGRFGDVGNYEPGNCKFMTPAEQIANWRSDRIRPWSKKKSIEQIAA